MKHLKIEAVRVWDAWAIKIIEQTHKGEEFCEGVFNTSNGIFTASNGFFLWSDASPGVALSGLYVQGSSSDWDGQVLISPKAEGWIERMEAAVHEYNERFRDAREVPASQRSVQVIKRVIE